MIVPSDTPGLNLHKLKHSPLLIHPNDLFRKGIKFENERKFKNKLILKAIFSMTVFLVSATLLFVSWSKLRGLFGTPVHSEAHITTIIRKVPFNYDSDTRAPNERTVLPDVRTQFIPPATFPLQTPAHLRFTRDADKQLTVLQTDEEFPVADEGGDDSAKELIWFKVSEKTKRNVIEQVETKLTTDPETSTVDYERSTTTVIKRPTVFWTDRKDRESVRRSQAERMLSYMDIKADPCQDFFQYACGRWGDINPIPEDRGGYDTFEILRESLEYVLRDLLIEPNQNDSQAFIKTKTLFRSCLDEKSIEARGNEPLLELLDTLGGWPVLKLDWNGTGFDWVELAAKLKRYHNDMIITVWIAPDFRDSSTHIIQFDQSALGLPTRDYFLLPHNQVFLDTYRTFMIRVAVLLGADLDKATVDADEIIAFEKDLARITTPMEDRRNMSGFYEKMSLEALEAQIPGIEWSSYLNSALNQSMNSSQSVVMYARKYYNQLVPFMKTANPRTVANYIIWRFVKNRVNNLGHNFQMAKEEFFRVLSGRMKMPPRWSTCVSHVNLNMGWAVGAMFVQRYFDEKSKNDTMDMTHAIMDSFKTMLDKIEWLDDDTRRLAQEKVAAMMLRIGYPDFVLDQEKLSEVYQNVTFEDDKFLENSIALLELTAQAERAKLGTKVNKSDWSISPAVVNAYYSRNRNQIMLPAGILQPPFYHKYFPRSINFGGIGVVIGHEITHGFDDKGRLFDIEGNLHRWWKEEAIEEFHQRAKCLIDQFNKYTVQEIDMNVDGHNTQGENIADSGGIKQAYVAYEKWLAIHGDEDETLPLLNATNKQLFFINFAQVWCGAMRPETSRNKMQTSTHSPNRFRVIGTLSNSNEFNQVFHCPSSTGMNPENKCNFW